MNPQAVLALFDRQMRREAPADAPEARIEHVGGVVRHVGTDHGWNGILWSDLDSGTADAAIREQIAHFTSLGREFEWKLYAHDRPADLADRLRAAGFTPEPEETLMVARIAELPTDVAPPDGIELRPVTDAAGVALLADVHQQAFGTDASHWQQLLDQLQRQPDTVAAVVAMAGEEPVSGARMEFPPGAEFASLWGGGTVPAWRGRGVYRSLVALRAQAAAERGYRYLQVDASDQSRPILQRLGFVPLTTTTPFVYDPAAR